MNRASLLINDTGAASTAPEQNRRRLSQRLRLWRGAAAAPRHPKPKRNLMAVLRQWHARAGLAAFAFLIWLALSGILLTRSVELGFDTARVDWPWLTRLYGLHAEAPANGFAAGAHYLAQTHDYTLLDGKPLPTQISAPLGMVAGGEPKDGLLFVASPESLVLLDGQGQRIDELRAPLLPSSAVRRIGVLKRDPRVIAIQDLDAFQSADEGNSWTPVQPGEVNWSTPTPLSDTQRAQLLDYARPRIIVEQLLIDLHSGRLFGPVGAWAITLVGFVALLLSVTGIWMWWRMHQNRKRNQAR